MQGARCPEPAAQSGARSGARCEGEAEGPLGPTVAVLVVSLVIAAVGAYELCGFGLHILNPRPRLFNNGFATAGVVVATMTAGAAVGNLVWLLTASRRHAVRTAPAGHGPSSDHPAPPRAAADTTDTAARSDLADTAGPADPYVPAPEAGPVPGTGPAPLG